MLKRNPICLIPSQASYDSLSEFNTITPFLKKTNLLFLNQNI
jgi:hypothetical protein